MKVRVKDRRATKLLVRARKMFMNLLRQRKATIPFSVSLSLMEKFGKVIDIYQGCIEFWLHCSSVDDLDGLWNVYTSGQMKETFQGDFLDSGLLEEYDIEDAEILVTIDENEYQTLRQKLIG